MKPHRRLFDPQLVSDVRRRRGFSQDALARTLGCTPQTISNWETGRALPNLRMLEALYETLGLEASVRVARNAGGSP